MKSNRARLADATMNAMVCECEGDPMTQVGLEEPSFAWLFTEPSSRLRTALCKIHIYIFFFILFDENSFNTPALMRTPVGRCC